MDLSADVSPLSSRYQMDKVMEYIAVGSEEGTRLAFGGRPLSGPTYDDGYYVEPTIFTDVGRPMRIAQEEIFGPVLTVLKAKDLDEAIDLANGVQFVLPSSICTRDLTKAFQYVDQVDAGMVHINAPTLGGTVHLPFGGLKPSSVGARDRPRFI